MPRPAVPNNEDFVQMEQALFDRIYLEKRDLDTIRTRNRTRRWVGVSVIAVVAVVTVSVVTTGVGWPGSRGASAAAAELLNKASDLVASSEDPAPKPGQFLAVTIRDNSRTTQIPDDQHYRVSWNQVQTVGVYYPQDQSVPPTEVRVAAAPVDVNGDAVGRAVLAEQWAKSSSGTATTTTNVAQLQFWIQTRADARSVPGGSRTLDYLKQTATTSSADSIWSRAIDLLDSGQLDATQRSGVYAALAKVPGVDIAEKQANLDGRVGTALSFTSTHGRQDEIIIDPSTGEFIGSRSVVSEVPSAPNAERAAVGTVVEWSSVSRAVVDAIPSSAEYTALYGAGS